MERAGRDRGRLSGNQVNDVEQKPLHKHADWLGEKLRLPMDAIIVNRSEL